MFSLLIKILISIAWAGGNFVGNGGDGYSTPDNKIYLRDLVEMGAHQNAWIGNEIDQNILSQLDNFIFPEDFPKELLAQKITDLNRTSKYFGDMVLQTLLMYNWVMVDAPLGMIADDGDIIQPIGTFVQIANRLGSTIRIHKSSWKEMNDTNQIALLIHEAIYGMLKPKPSTLNFYTQSPRKAREIVGLMFTTNFKTRGHNIFTNMIANELNIPEGNKLTTVTNKLFWEILINTNNKEQNQFIENRILKSESLENLQKFVQEQCSTLILLKQKKPNAIVSLVSTMPLPPFSTHFIIYNSQFGEQYAVEIYEQPTRFEIILQAEIKTTAEQCFNELNTQIKKNQTEQYALI